MLNLALAAQHASAPVTMLGLRTERLFLEIWDRVKDDGTIPHLADLQSYKQLAHFKQWYPTCSGAVAKVKVLHFSSEGGCHASVVMPSP